MNLPVFLQSTGIFDPRFPVHAILPNPIAAPVGSFIAAEEWRNGLVPDADLVVLKYGDLMTGFRIENDEGTLSLIIDGLEVGELAENSVLPMWAIPMRSVQLRVRTSQPHVTVRALNVFLQHRERLELKTATLHCGFPNFVVHGGVLDFA